jgi:phosphopantothenate synthetase
VIYKLKQTGGITMAKKMSKEDKERLCELLEDYKWEHNDAELTMQIQMLIYKVEEEI